MTSALRVSQRQLSVNASGSASPDATAVTLLDLDEGNNVGRQKSWNPNTGFPSDVAQANSIPVPPEVFVFASGSDPNPAVK